MRNRRLPLFMWLAIPIASLALLTRTGQAQVTSALDLVVGVGLPGVERGVMLDASRVPDSAEGAWRRVTSVAGDRVGLEGERYVSGKVIVKFREGMSSGQRVSALSLSAPRAVLSARPSDADFDVIAIDPNADPVDVARTLAERPDVEYAQPAHRVHTEFVPNDPLYKQLQWNLPLIDLERAWDIQPQAGSSIIVAVIDTGVAYTAATLTPTLGAFTLNGLLYPALGRVTVPYASAPQLGSASRFVAPRDFVCGGTTPIDFDGHGTHVSGTIGQTTNDNVGTAGVAFNVRIMPIKVLASAWDVRFGCASQEGGTDDDVARGIRYAADNGAKVINMSLGGPGPAGSAPVVEAAVRYAVGKGVFVAIAGGNDFEAGNPTEAIAEIASRVPGAVSVAAVDPLKQRAWYSSTGTWVELAAPGGSNRGFGDGGYIWQQTLDFNVSDPATTPARYVAPRFDIFATIGFVGTSQATAHVSALAAMMMQQGITDPAAVERVLESTATDIGAAGRDSSFGFGLIEARSALRGLGIVK